ncbi:glycosyltransferase [Thermococcus sp.]
MEDYCIIVRRLTTKAGGIGVYTKNLIKKLENSGYHIVISPPEKISYLLWQFFVVPLWLVKSKCNIYHAVGVIEGIVLPIFKPKAKKIITIHDLIPLKFPRKGFKGIVERFFIRLGLISAKRYEVIYAVSHLTKIDIIRFAGIPEDRIRIIYQPIDDRFFTGPRKLGKFRESGKFMIGYISRMDYHKRHALLVELFRHWDNPNVRLLLAGTGKEFERVKKLIRRDERIKLLGFISDEELVEFYDSIDVYVHTSRYEGWGLPIAEALARGKPVIVLDDAELPKEIMNLCLKIPSYELLKTLELLAEDRKNIKRLSILGVKALKILFR